MTTTLETERLQHISIDKIAECDHNPRRHFDAERLAELSASVLEHGVLTPLLVRPRPDGRTVFELAAGHRRLRAAKAAGLKTVPAIVREMDDRQFAEVLCIENLQRADLDELDEAEGFRQLRDLAGYDVPAIALRLSRSEKYVYDRLKLLDLVPDAQELLRRGLINAGHAILIARLPADEQQRAIHPGHGGVFTHESPDHRGLFDHRPSRLIEALDEEKDQWAGRKAKTVRELEAWINANVRLDRANLDPVYESDAARSLFENQQAEDPLQVVLITRLGAVPPSARADERTLCASSWKRADGEEELDPRTWRRTTSKICEHVVKGVVVVGPGRGEVFDICTAKKACKVHWREEQKRATHATQNTTEVSRAHNQAMQRREREQLLCSQRQTAMEKVFTELEAIVRGEVGRMELDQNSKLLQVAFREFGAGFDLSEADCDALLARSRDGFRAIVELRALGMLRTAADEAGRALGDPQLELKGADALLGGNKLASAFAAALKGVQTSALAEKRAAAKSGKAKAGKPRGKAKRAGRTRSALPLVLAAAAALFLLAVSGCNGPGWQRVASTLEVGAGTTDHRADDALGNPIYADSTQLWVTVHPLAFLEPPTQVVIVKGKGE